MLSTKLPILIASKTHGWFNLKPATRSLTPAVACARLRDAVARRKTLRAARDQWDFGLCATIPREPRQARKGATVAGQLRVPQSTRSSSYRERVSNNSNPACEMGATA